MSATWTGRICVFVDEPNPDTDQKVNGVTLKNGQESTVRAKPVVPIEPLWIG